jgi:sigma-B regulation protein RsbU (phosphoserine phosphatase)
MTPTNSLVNTLVAGFSPAPLGATIENLLKDTLQWLSRALRIERVLLFVKAGERFEIACSTGVRGRKRSVSRAGSIERVLNGRKEPVLIRWEHGTAHVYCQPLGSEESEVLADLGANILLSLGSDGFLCLGRKAGDEPMATTDFVLLQMMGSRAALTIENFRLSSALAAESAVRQKLDWEVEVAREVQNRIFPSERPMIPGLDYYGDWRPARGVSGDYLDYFEMDEGNLGLAVGDVSGKGLPAALLTSSLHSIVRALRRSQTTSLPELVRTVDELFYEICPDNCYATLFVARYDPVGGKLHYVNAGHEPPFVLRKRGNQYHPVPLESGGPVIGLLREPSYREGVVSLNPGDMVVAYTDGLCEAKNPAGEEWGWRRLVDTISAAAEQRSREIVDAVMEAAETFAAGEPPFDDMTLWLGRVEESVATRPLWNVERLAVAAAA